MNGLAAGWQLLANTWRAPGGSPISLSAEWRRWAGRRWLRLLGWPGIVGAGLLAMCAAFYFSAILPAQANLQQARKNAVSIQDRVKHAAHALNRSQLPPAEQLAEFYRIFPGDRSLLPWIEKVFAIAQSQGLKLDQGEYRVSRDRLGKLTRFQMTLPVKSEYPQIRKFLNSLRAEIPIVSLEQLQFQRQRIDDSAVEAKIVLALYLGHES